MYLVQVQDGLPLVVALHVEVAHTNLTEVTRVVLVDVGAVVVLSAGVSDSILGKRASRARIT